MTVIDTIDNKKACNRCDFRFMVEKMVESEVLFFTQSNTTNAFGLLFDSLLLHRTKKPVESTHLVLKSAESADFHILPALYLVLLRLNPLQVLLQQN